MRETGAIAPNDAEREKTMRKYEVDVPDLLRFSSGSPNSASSAAICWLIAVWVMKLFCAPRVMLPVCATARKYANRSNFKGVPLLPAG